MNTLESIPWRVQASLVRKGRKYNTRRGVIVNGSGVGFNTKVGLIKLHSWGYSQPP